MLGTLFFDKQDRELLRMINETIDHGPSQDLEHKVFDANLHPHGILELTTTHEYRMAHAVINLLGNLEAGGAPDRLMALRILRDEVLHSARTPFRYNTGRVLIQIMKEIIRSRQDELTQEGVRQEKLMRVPINGNIPLSVFIRSLAFPEYQLVMAAPINGIPRPNPAL